MTSLPLSISHRGFTLIELLVVIVILGILTTVGLGNYTQSQKKSRDAQRKSDLKQIENALEIFYNDKGEYPLAVNGMILACPATGVFFSGCTEFSFSNPACDLNGDGRVSARDSSQFINASRSQPCTWGGGPLTDKKVIYLTEVPADPTGTLPYCYKSSEDKSKYQLFAKLEGTDEPVNFSCGGNSYNFGSASPNTDLEESI